MSSSVAESSNSSVGGQEQEARRQRPIGKSSEDEQEEESSSSSSDTSDEDENEDEDTDNNAARKADNEGKKKDRDGKKDKKRGELVGILGWGGGPGRKGTDDLPVSPRDGPNLAAAQGTGSFRPVSTGGATVPINTDRDKPPAQRPRLGGFPPTFHRFSVLVRGHMYVALLGLAKLTPCAVYV